MTVMTVSELRRILENYPGDMEVKLYDGNLEETTFIDEVFPSSVENNVLVIA